MNRFKVGDKVEILSLTEEEKETYPPGWLTSMEQYIGQITTVEQSFKEGRYKLKNTGDWIWSEKHLERQNT